MAAPNIVGVTSILGKTAVANVETVAANVVSNAASSGKVLKINNLIISNIDGANTADITATVLRSSVGFALASTISIPADATLVVISKESAVYLEEGDAISVSASANGDLQAICSYEEIS
jgi:hypothetical protein